VDAAGSGRPQAIGTATSVFAGRTARWCQVGCRSRAVTERVVNDRDRESSVKKFDGGEELEGTGGSHLGDSNWRTTQSQSDQFAEPPAIATGSTSTRTPAANGPFGTTRAHGDLTVSLRSGSFLISARSPG
jgi:hypothetical protein